MIDFTSNRLWIKFSEIRNLTLRKSRNPFCNEKDLFDKKSNQIKLQFVDERTYYSTIERM